MAEGGGVGTDGPFVVSLSDPDATDPHLVGGKGANLARLATAGFRVPDGFCVTTVAFRRLVDQDTRAAIGRLSELDPTDTASIADAGATVRSLIREGAFPDEVRDAIARMLDADERPSETAYAVRSSATAEDLPTASFAGQQETFLNVRGADEVVDRVRACMASLFTDRAITYRAQRGIPHEDVSIAVVVQRMVSPGVSGVLFTADPKTGNRHRTSIEACLGLGEGVVSGAVHADSIHVDARTARILTYDVGDQQSAVRPGSDGGTETVELPRTERSSRVLADEQVRTLVEVGADIEALFDRPQDIEWSMTDGELSILQARPITSLFPLPSPAPTDDRLHVYISMGHGQSFAEAMPPLVTDLWRSYVQLLFTEYGFDPETRWAVEAGGRIYIDVTSPLRFGLLRKRFPERMAEANERMGAAIGDLIDRRGAEFRDDRTLRQQLASVPALASTGWTVLRNALPQLRTSFGGFFGAFVGDPTPPQREAAKWEAWGTSIASQAMTSGDVTANVRGVFDVPVEAAHYPSMGSLVAGITAQGLLERRFADAPADVTAVGRGLPEEMVTRINTGISDLADVARDHPAVVDALDRDASPEAIGSVDGGEPFLAALEEFLDAFGHRATGELDVSRPRWRDDPAVLLSIVRSTIRARGSGEHREDVRALEQRAQAAAERLERRAGRGLLGPLRRPVVRQLVRTYRGGIQTREYPKHGVAYFLAAWHEVLRDAGERLASEGALAGPEDVWFLREDELVDALEGGSVDVDFAARRAEFRKNVALDAPPVLTSEGEALSGDVERGDVPAGALVGTGVSGGVVEGPARVVRDPSDATVERGDVLVVPSSDPGWTPLFLNASGVVVEVGGQMSHGSLVAREYGLPAVVSVPNATRELRTGQRVRVDGTNGTVERVT